MVFGGRALVWRPINAQSPHFVQQCRTFHAQHHGRAVRTSEHPIGVLQCSENVVTFGFSKRSRSTAGISSPRFGWPRKREHGTGRNHHGTLYDILQLAHVARPSVMHQCLHVFRKNIFDSSVHLAFILAHKVPDQGWSPPRGRATEGFQWGKRLGGNINLCGSGRWPLTPSGCGWWQLPIGSPLGWSASFRGYLITGPDLSLNGKSTHKWPLDRSPYHLETNVPGLFAAGDVRHGSVKRCASAVGEGAMAVTFVHRYLATG